MLNMIYEGFEFISVVQSIFVNVSYFIHTSIFIQVLVFGRKLFCVAIDLNKYREFPLVPVWIW
jgi:hypothetical protein